MPLCTLYLISLNPQTSLLHFLTSLDAWSIRPITTAKVIRWIIIPEQIDTATLLQPIRPYQLLLILPPSGTGRPTVLPGVLESKISACFTVQVGIPSRLLKDYQSKNRALLHPLSQDSIPTLTGSLDNEPIIESSSQTLTLSPELQSWIDQFSKSSGGKGALSMLNLLSFKHDMKASYLEYGKAFADTIGSRRGGDAKLVGHIINTHSETTVSAASRSTMQKTWDEFALAHYPSILHFADMLASRDYQEVNQKYCVPALYDTCILCTSELDVEEILHGMTNNRNDNGATIGAKTTINNSKL